MSGFAALMALSASQTRQVQSAVQTALEQRQRNEELNRKKREEAERKVREEEAKLRQKRFEDEKKEEEREARRAAEQAQRAREQARREDEARQALLYGPKKAKQHPHAHSPGGPKWPTSQSGVREEVRRRRVGDKDGDGDGAGGDGDGSPAVALTREEKRQRRVDLETRRMYKGKHEGGAGGGRRLPGGAIDAPSSSARSSKARDSARSVKAGGPARSVKARLAALPNTLTKLNVNKRDVRTIDEILRDRAKAKNTTLDGDDAREFNDWFGKAKKKEPVSLPGTQSTVTLSSASSSDGLSPSQGGAHATSQPPVRSQSLAASAKMSTSGGSRSAASHSRSMLSAKSSSAVLKHSSQSKSPVPKTHATKAGSVSGSGNVPPRSGKVPPLPPPLRKRPRSPSMSLSPSPPLPTKRRAASESENTIGSEIWKLFGKDRDSYVARDVMSDDEDMEADAGSVMKEEIRSARLARREDEVAFEEEKRHENEKRRRKRERERQGI